MSNITYPNLYDTRDVPKDIGDSFGTDDSPKLKFNWFVKFSFRQNAPDSLGELKLSNELALKQGGRPTPVITYQDVNYYGFRTKVATKTDFSTFNLTFYDDGANRAHSIVDAYMEAVSPLASQVGAEGNPLKAADSVTSLQTVQALQDSNELGAIELITILHYSLNQTTTYTFFNPKITNVMLDELDMTASETNTVSMSFVYDGYNVGKFGPAGQ